MFDNEKSLIKKAQKGQVDAFEKLIIKYEKKIYNMCYHMFHNEQDAYDISQEVFIKVYKSIKTFNYACEFSTWLHRITINTSIDELRKRKNKNVISLDVSVNLSDTCVTRQIEDTSLTPEERIIQKENNIEITAMIDMLKEEHKTIIILRDIKGYSYEEIANILNCSSGTVKSRLSRARSKLKEIYLKSLEQNHYINVK